MKFLYLFRGADNLTDPNPRSFPFKNTAFQKIWPNLRKPLLKAKEIENDFFFLLNSYICRLYLLNNKSINPRFNSFTQIFVKTHLRFIPLTRLFHERMHNLINIFKILPLGKIKPVVTKKIENYECWRGGKSFYIPFDWLKPVAKFYAQKMCLVKRMWKFDRKFNCCRENFGLAAFTTRHKI